LSTILGQRLTFARQVRQVKIRCQRIDGQAGWFVRSSKFQFIETFSQLVEPQPHPPSGSSQSTVRPAFPDDRTRLRDWPFGPGRLPCAA